MGTPNLGLSITSASSGSAISFLAWRLLQDGNSSEANMYKIDDWAETIDTSASAIRSGSYLVLQLNSELGNESLFTTGSSLDFIINNAASSIILGVLSDGPINASGSSLLLNVTGILDASGSSLEIHAENPIEVTGSSIELNINNNTLELDTGNLSQKSNIVTTGSYNTVEVDTYGRVTSGSTFDWISGSIVNEIVFRNAEELTISSGAITITQSLHTIAPETGTTDNLDTINGLNDGQFAIFRSATPGTDIITIKHDVGNISCFGGFDITLSEGIAIATRIGSTVYVAGGGGGVNVQDEGVDLESEYYLDFRGAGISASQVPSASAIQVEVDWNQHSGTISASTIVTIPSGVGSVVVGAIEIEGELNVEGTMVVL